MRSSAEKGSPGVLLDHNRSSTAHCISRRTAGKLLLAGSAGAWLGIPDANAAQAQRSSAPAASGPAEWSDVLLVNEENEWTISYRTGWVVYEETFRYGQLLGRGWNGAGFINFYDGRIKPSDVRQPQAFRLEIDGQSLDTGWRWGGLAVAETPKGAKHAVITLTHEARPVTVKVHTLLDGTAILTRWLEITSAATSPVALASVSSWSGVLRKNQNWSGVVRDAGKPLYEVGYFDESRWGTEGNFQWHELPFAEYSFAGRYLRHQHGHPFFLVRNNATGEHFIGQLAWSGGYSFHFDLSDELGRDGPDRFSNDAALTFSAGPDGAAPLRVIAPGETVSSPEMHLGLVYGGLDEAVQAMHRHIRRSVLSAPARGRRNWIISGIGPEVEITPTQVEHAIEAAKEIGAEVFFIDASWYAPPQGDWWATVGDWKVDTTRFPQGLKPFRDKVHAAGMLWGLWMDAERVGEKSAIGKEHPDWLARNYDGKRDMGGLLDITIPEAAEWMEAQIAHVIEENELDFFRLDYNTDPKRGILSAQSGYQENGYWRYYETLYAMYARLRRRFPRVVFENCAGGGARTDLGMLRGFNHTDITDWQIAPRSFAITNGMTMALPPECMDRLVGGQSGHTAADLDFQLRQLFFSLPKFGFLYPLGATPNPLLLERVKQWVKLYKSFVRPFIDDCLVFHHTPDVGGAAAHGWGVLEMCSDDRSRGVCGVFHLGGTREEHYLLQLCGVDVSKRYKVTWGNAGQSYITAGAVLAQQGVTVRLEGALTSELLVYEVVTDAEGDQHAAGRAERR